MAEIEHPDYDSIHTVADCDALILQHKEHLVSRDITERNIKDEKKAYVKEMNIQLKEIAEEREHEMGIIGVLEERKKMLLSGVIPMPRAASSP